jgi:hypothetical protein
MTSTVSLINPATVSIALVKKTDNLLYNVVLNLYGLENEYIGSLTTELTSTSKTKITIMAYNSVRGFYSRVSASAKVFENGVHVDTVNVQDLLDNPDKIQGEYLGSEFLH